jgi:hypothetical protein
MLARGGRSRTAAGYALAFATNAVSRQALGFWLERVVFSDPRDALPLPLSDYKSRQVPLDTRNFQPAILASCSIPFWLKAVHDIPGAPTGAYWDGGITDYHLHLRYDALGSQQSGGLALYPHFQPSVVPGWLDKPLKRRHGASPALSRLVLLSPRPEWIATLPRAKLPDRSDFKFFARNISGRIAAWRRAVAESEALAEELAEALGDNAARHIEAL